MLAPLSVFYKTNIKLPILFGLILMIIAIYDHSKNINLTEFNIDTAKYVNCFEY